MRVPYRWLKTYAPLAVDAKTCADAMTLSGTKMETLEHAGENLKNIVVGKVLSIEKHPNADKLVVTQVDIGNQTLQIVTGAANLSVGDVVSVAVDGAALADGKTIHSGELRGVASNGMLCSIEELGAARADFPEAPEHGIYVFPEDNRPALGADAAEALQLRDDIIEFEITSNRADCFSVVGVAREAAATFGVAFNPPEPAVKALASGQAADFAQVEIQNETLCPRYAARVVKNVKIAPSPLWMRRRLSLAGLRPINNIVDITNYVMLELGQPMHAFDIGQISGGRIIVRNARDGEAFTTLDGEARTLDAGMLVIADRDKAVAIAGVMGGENSKVTDGAAAILFESANFNGANIRKTSKRLGLRTDSSAKYEKGLDPNLAEYAVNRAAELVELLNCGEVVPGMVDAYPNPRQPRTVAYRAANINKLLGTDIAEAEMARLLNLVGVPTIGGAAQIPTFRPDIALEADIAEEVARLHGYDKIPETLVTGTPTAGKRTARQTLEDIIKGTMTALGFSEALTYAFESPKTADKLRLAADSPLRDTVNILNPLGEDYSQMRTQTVNALLSALAANYGKRNESAALFELAKTYHPEPGDGTPVTETPCLTLAAYGDWDFFKFKGAADCLLSRLGVPRADWSPVSDIPYLHPGRAAACACGHLGEAHPAVLNNYEIGARAYVAVLDFETLFQSSNLSAQYKPVPRFPGAKRDIALLVNEAVLARDMEAAIREAGGKLLEGVSLFDVYTGAGVAEGQKSVAYSVAFRAPDRTLTDDEVSAALSAIITNLNKRVNAKLRS